jgi:hypothetical protein
MTSNGETLNMKVVDPEKLWNFLVYNILFEVILSLKFKFESLWPSNTVVSLLVGGHPPAQIAISSGTRLLAGVAPASTKAF